MSGKTDSFSDIYKVKHKAEGSICSIESSERGISYADSNQHEEQINGLPRYGMPVSETDQI